MLQGAPLGCPSAQWRLEHRPCIHQQQSAKQPARVRRRGCPASSAAASVQHGAASTVQFRVLNEDSMAILAAELAADLQPGDVYFLHGEVGAGKSVFSRAFIRAAVGDDSLPVPSPTFLLQNVYEGEAEPGEAPMPPIHHFDLYRLEGVQGGAWERLNLRASFSQAVCLVEWPERVPADMAPARHLDVTIAIQAGKNRVGAGGSGEFSAESSSDEFTDVRPRLVTLSAHEQYWQGRLTRLHRDAEHWAAEAEALGLVVLPAL